MTRLNVFLQLLYFGVGCAVSAACLAGIIVGLLLVGEWLERVRIHLDKR